MVALLHAGKLGGKEGVIQEGRTELNTRVESNYSGPGAAASDLTLKHTLESSLVSLSLSVLYSQPDYHNLKGGDSMKYSL